MGEVEQEISIAIEKLSLLDKINKATIYYSFEIL
jgi:hypothetical protein